MIMRGKPMNGWLRVADQRVADEDTLAHWVRVGTSMAGSLPAK
jgi:hypothetical protein